MTGKVKPKHCLIVTKRVFAYLGGYLLVESLLKKIPMESVVCVEGNVDFAVGRSFIPGHSSSIGCNQCKDEYG